MAHIAELESLLSSQEMYIDHYFARDAMKKVLSQMNSGDDIGSLSPVLMKLLAHPDLLVKKVACRFVTEYSQTKSDLMVLGINTLTTDCSDSNPMVRALALKTLCSLQNEAYLEYGLRLIKQGLRDRSAYVRRAAVNCSLRLYKVTPSAILEEGLVDELYSALRDQDPVVVMNALSSLEEMLSEEGGIVLSQNLTYHLLNYLPSLTEWGLVTAFNILTKYRPKNEEEMFDVMNVTDEYLKHTNIAVCASCLKFFMNLVKNAPELKQEIIVRARESLLMQLASTYPENTYAALDLIQSYLPEYKSAFAGHINAFLCRISEPSYVKVKRLEILATFSSKDNIEAVVEELALNSSNFDRHVAEVALSKLADVAIILPECLPSCLKKLTELIDIVTENNLSNIVLAVERLAEVNKTEVLSVMEVLTHKYQSLTHGTGRGSFVRLLSVYREDFSECIYILEDIVELWLADADAELKRSILTTTLKLFFSSPGFGQDILGQLLETCANDKEKDLSECAVFYYKLLQCDINLAKQVVLGENKCLN